MKKKIIVTALMLGFIVSTFNPLQVSAADKLTLRMLQNNYNSWKSKYEENQRKLNLTQAEINSKKARIVTLRNEMNAISKEVVKLNDEIDEYKLKIKDKIVASKNLIEQYQMNTSNELYYDYIFNADNISDVTSGMILILTP